MDKEQLAIAYYRWASAKAKSEFDDDFPLVRRVRSRVAYKFLEFVRTLHPSERVVAASAFGKRFHADVLAALGEIPNQDEKGIMERFTAFDVRKIDPVVPAEFQSKLEWQFSQNLRGYTRRITAQRLTSLLMSKIAASTGDKPTTASGEVIVYDKQSGNWRLKTSIDVEGRRPLADYSHSIFAPDGKPAFPFISALAWMGISGQTEWDLFTDAEADSVSDEIASHVTWFWQRWTELAGQLGA